MGMLRLAEMRPCLECGSTPFNQHLEAEVCLRPAWSIDGVLGQPEIHRKTLSQR